MAANVETMFSTREKPWHGLGTIVMTAPTSKDALRLAGLDWKVEQEPIYTETNELISGYKANVRNTDRSVLGVVTDRYKVIQNDEAFADHIGTETLQDGHVTENETRDHCQCISDRKHDRALRSTGRIMPSDDRERTSVLFADTEHSDGSVWNVAEDTRCSFSVI